MTWDEGTRAGCPFWRHGGWRGPAGGSGSASGGSPRASDTVVIVSGFSEKPSQDPSHTPGSSFPVPHAVVRLLVSCQDPLKTQHLPPRLVSFQGSATPFVQLLQLESWNALGPLPPLGSHGQRVTSPHPVFFQWYLPLCLAVHACSCDKPSGSSSPLTSCTTALLHPCIWPAIHLVHFCYALTPPDSRPCHCSPMATQSNPSLLAAGSDHLLPPALVWWAQPHPLPLPGLPACTQAAL